MRHEGTIELWLLEPTQDLYGVFVFTPCGSTKMVEVRGMTPNYSIGELVEVIGGDIYQEWGRFYLQATWVRRPAPPRFESFWTFVKAGLVPGIGEVTARKIHVHFGAELENVMRSQYRRLEEVSGITPKKAEDLHKAICTRDPFIDLVELLLSAAANPPAIRRVALEFGSNAIQTIWKNPYCLVRVEGLGFRAADAVAQRISFRLGGHERMIGALIAALLKAATSGHCFLSRSTLVGRASSFVGHMERSALEAAIPAAVESGELVCEEGEAPPYFLPELLTAEKDVAHGLVTRAKLPAKPSVPSAKTVREWITEKRIGIGLDQVADFRRLLGAQVGVLTGGPGVGKTTWVRSLLEAMRLEHLERPMNIVLCAPTGRAARRLEEATGRNAMTIHRLLGSRDGRSFACNAGNRIKVDLVIVDEASMVAVDLMANLLRGIQPHARLLLVGDQDQLPSVGAGKVLADVLESKVGEVVRLTEVHRQAQGSAIPSIVAKVKEGTFDPQVDMQGSPGVCFRAAADESVAATLVVQEFLGHCRKGTQYPAENVQILAPTKAGEAGVHELNRRIQNELLRLGHLDENNQVMRCAGECGFRVGDRVMQTRNNYEHDIFNGDIGYVRKVDNVKGTASVDFDKLGVNLTRRECLDLTLAYAITVHKSQGSEFQQVIVVFDSAQGRVLNRPLVYTALSRARNQIVVIGNPMAIRQAVHRTDHKLRNSSLVKRIVGQMNEPAPAPSPTPVSKPTQTWFPFDEPGLNGHAQ